MQNNAEENWLGYWFDSSKPIAGSFNSNDIILETAIHDHAWIIVSSTHESQRQGSDCCVRKVL